MEHDGTQVTKLDPEALEGLPRNAEDVRFTDEDLEHLANLLIDVQDLWSATALPGAEHTYAKVHLLVRGRTGPLAPPEPEEESW